MGGEGQGAEGENTIIPRAQTTAKLPAIITNYPKYFLEVHFLGFFW